MLRSWLKLTTIPCMLGVTWQPDLSVQTLSLAGGDVGTGQALVALAASFTNFEAARALANLTGWTRSTVHAPCRWSRVTCDEAGTVTGIDLSSLSLQGACGTASEHCRAVFRCCNHPATCCMVGCMGCIVQTPCCEQILSLSEA